MKKFHIKYMVILLTVILLLAFAVPAAALQVVRLGPSYFPDPTRGRPVAFGSIYVGDPDTDPTVVVNQKQVSVLEEDGSVTEISQPVSTNAGGVPTYLGASVTLLVGFGQYSMAILNSGGTQVYYNPSQTGDSTPFPSAWWAEGTDPPGVLPAVGAGVDGVAIGDGNSITASVDSGIFMGDGNTIATGTAFIGGGFNNTINSGSPGSAIIGGIIGTIGSNSNRAIIAGGNSSDIGEDAPDVVLLGGTALWAKDNTDYSGILAGHTNIIEANSQYAAIIAGQNGTIGEAATHSVLVGGNSHSIGNNSTHSFIGGGSDHTIDTSNRSAIVGGVTNTTSSGDTFQGGGQGNDISTSAARSAILGGNSNDIAAGSLNAGMLGGDANDIDTSADRAATIGGIFNTVSASDAVALGGNGNTLLGLRSVTLGGVSLTTSTGAPHSAVMGKDAATTMRGQLAGSSGNGSTTLSQWSIVSVNLVTANANQGSMKLDVSDNITVESGETIHFVANISAVQTAGAAGSVGDSGGYVVTGLIKNVAGTTTMVGVATVTTAEDEAAWDATATANDSTDALDIKVTGEASKTISWSATVILTHVQ